jgi:Sec-independent protein translocase protein TatA
MTEEKLRENIRQAIRIVKKKKSMAENQAAQDESTLREVVRKFISAEMKLLNEATPDNDPAPHENTGINVLEDLLKKIIPILETDYKLLTTSSEQRESFRSHIINAAVGTLTPVEANNDAVKDSDDGDLDEEVNVDIVDDNDERSKFIDINPSPEPEEEEEADPRDEFGIKGADVTGRNMAYASFKKVESSIVDAYDLLDNTEDQDLFYDYLIANLKLYFDKFESELNPESTEPTNQAYDTAKKSETDTEDTSDQIDFNL